LPLVLLGLAFLLVPLIGLLTQASWSTLPSRLVIADVGQALKLSLLCASAATVLGLLLGVPLAWLLARTHLPRRGIIRALVTIPIVLTPVVGGVALLLMLGATRPDREAPRPVVRVFVALHTGRGSGRRVVRGAGMNRRGRSGRRTCGRSGWFSRTTCCSIT
jgi:ABC-type sulfate transport system permease component